MNSFSFTGNLGKDAVLKVVADGEHVCNFSVANKVRRKGEEKIQWINCSIWGKRAEGIAQYLKTGTKVFCTGSLLLENYTSREGDLRPILKCTVTDMEFVSANKKDKEELYNSDNYAKDDVNF